MPVWFGSVSVRSRSVRAFSVEAPRDQPVQRGCPAPAEPADRGRVERVDRDHDHAGDRSGCAGDLARTVDGSRRLLGGSGRAASTGGEGDDEHAGEGVGAGPEHALRLGHVTVISVARTCTEGVRTPSLSPRARHVPLRSALPRTPMRLTVVGCSGSYPGPASPASCYLLEADLDGRTWRVLVDLGSGALGALHQYVDPLAIDAVFLSHLHADHCLDLCGYYVLRKYHPDGHQPRIPVYGPAGTADRMARAYDLPTDPGMTRGVRLPRVRRRGRARPVPGGADPGRAPGAGVRPADRARTARPSATPATPDPARGWTRSPPSVDLLLAEASFGHATTTRPSSTSPAPSAARRPPADGVERLVLTHVPPWYDPQEALARPARRTPARSRSPRRRGLRPVAAGWFRDGSCATSQPPNHSLVEEGRLAARLETSRAPVRPGRRRGRGSRSGPGW